MIPHDANHRRNWDLGAQVFTDCFFFTCTNGVVARCPAIAPRPAQTCKFKGLVNDGIQIKASFSTDGMFVVSGSEDGQVSDVPAPLNVGALGT